MAKYQIPENHRPGFDAIIKLNNEDANALAKAIKDVPVGASPKSFFNQLQEQLEINGISKIAFTLSSLVGLRAFEGTSDEGTAQEVAESYSESVENELSKEEYDNLVNKLTLFFSSFQNLISTYKANNLLLANDKLYKESKVISDIRIVFNENIEESNRHAVIIHNLQLKYLCMDDEKEFFISLNTADLKELKEQVERALEKDFLIKKDYNIINFIDIE
jgi:hypothetical protein